MNIKKFKKVKQVPVEKHRLKRKKTGNGLGTNNVISGGKIKEISSEMFKKDSSTKTVAAAR